MREPQQSFDVLPMARVRVRGTQEQVAKVHAWIGQQTAARRLLPFTVAQGVSGAIGASPDCKQWATHFNIASDLVDELRTFLVSIGIKEEA